MPDPAPATAHGIRITEGTDAHGYWVRVDHDGQLVYAGWARNEGLGVSVRRAAARIGYGLRCRGRKATGERVGVVEV